MKAAVSARSSSISATHDRAGQQRAARRRPARPSRSGRSVAGSQVSEPSAGRSSGGGRSRRHGPILRHRVVRVQAGWPIAALTGRDPTVAAAVRPSGWPHDRPAPLRRHRRARRPRARHLLRRAARHGGEGRARRRLGRRSPAPATGSPSSRRPTCSRRTGRTPTDPSSSTSTSGWPTSTRPSRRCSRSAPGGCPAGAATSASTPTRSATPSAWCGTRERRPAVGRPRPRPARSWRRSKFEVTEATGTRVTGTVDLGPDQHTPWGVVHGGVYCSVVESAASIGASTAVVDRGQFAVGVNNNTDFLRADDRRPRSTSSPSRSSRAARCSSGRCCSPAPTTASWSPAGQVRLQNVPLPGGS